MAATAGLAVSLWEIACIFAFQKVLFSMWVLILTAQFLVFIAIWSINFPRSARFILYELRKIALGEFLDDLELGARINETLGIQGSSNSSTDTKVGEERLGSADILTSFGPTSIVLTALFTFILILVTILVVLCRRSSLCQRCSKCVQAVASKVFFNPIIRYVMLNSLKLNISSLVVLNAN